MMKKAVIILLLGLIFGCQDDYRQKFDHRSRRMVQARGSTDIGILGSQVRRKEWNGSQIRLRAL